MNNYYDWNSELKKENEIIIRPIIIGKKGAGKKEGVKRYRFNKISDFVMSEKFDKYVFVFITVGTFYIFTQIVRWLYYVC